MLNFNKDKRLGSAKGRHTYDIPLQKSVGTGFLILLIALMSFMAIMMLSGSFALSGMSERWSTGLEHKMTIEIPAEGADGALRSPTDIETLTQTVAKQLRSNEHIKQFKALDRKDVQDLISPWLGNDMLLDDIPVPGLISVELHSTTPAITEQLRKNLRSINSNIRLDTHETWLADLLRITGTLQSTALLIALIIGATTIIAVGGSIRTRMAIHKEDVELLHLMGANDRYITRQFQRHALILAIKGCALGALGSLSALILIHLFWKGGAATMLPDAALSTGHIIILLCVPVITCIIAALAARFTVLRVLAMMP